MRGKIARLFEASAVYLCTGCSEQVQLDDAVVTHSDRVHCLCLACVTKHLPGAARLSSSPLAQFVEASRHGDPPDYDWPVW